ncbi:hypothetical protein Emag_001128 [Eimeria magna]
MHATSSRLQSQLIISTGVQVYLQQQQQQQQRGLPDSSFLYTLQQAEISSRGSNSSTSSNSSNNRAAAVVATKTAEASAAGEAVAPEQQHYQRQQRQQISSSTTAAATAAATAATAAASDQWNPRPQNALKAGGCQWGPCDYPSVCELLPLVSRGQQQLREETLAAVLQQPTYLPFCCFLSSEENEREQLPIFAEQQMDASSASSSPHPSEAAV